MIDIAPAPLPTLPEIYVAAFNRKTARLSDSLRARLLKSRAVIVRWRPMITIAGRPIAAAVETIFEQIRPCIWRFRSQLVETDGPASPADQQTLREWGVDRRRHFEAPEGPRLAPVFDTLASMLESGREGRDYVLLSRVPDVTTTT